MSQNPILKGSLVPIILKLLDAEGKMYGYEITQKVKELTNGELIITEGALYPTLHRLEAEGLLDTHTAIVDNRVRKYYQLTISGQKEKEVRIAEFQGVLQQLQFILFPQPNLLKT